MILKFHSQFHELLVALRKVFLKLGDRLRSTNTGNNVLALCVDQVLTENTLLTCGRVTCKGNTCTRCLTLVTEYHCLYVYCSTPVAWNIIHTTVNDRTRVVPGTEYSFHSSH